MANDKSGSALRADNTKTYIQRLSITNPLREPVIREAVRTLKFPRGSRGLDAGCGIGLQTVLLAEAVGPGGRVTGLDISPAFLNRARQVVTAKGLSERVIFREGNIENIPFEDRTFDWLWSADCAGYYPVSDHPQLIKELARVVKPGGVVALVIYSSQMLLPGYPRLEARLNATTAGIAPFKDSMSAEQHFLRGLGWLRKAGMENTSAATLIWSTYAPLDKDTRRGLTALIQMRWEDAEHELSPKDRDEYRLLCSPESPDFILNEPDYYGFFTYTVFKGTIVP